MPDEAAQELPQGPAFVPASVEDGVFQEIRLLFQPLEAPAAAFEDIPLVVRLHADLAKVIGVDVLRVLIHLPGGPWNCAVEGLPEKNFLRMKRSALGRRIRSLDSFDATCFRVCAYHFSDFDYFRFPEVYRSIEATEIQGFLNRVVKEERCSLSIINPIE